MITYCGFGIVRPVLLVSTVCISPRASTSTNKDLAGHSVRAGSVPSNNTCLRSYGDYVGSVSLYDTRVESGLGRREAKTRGQRKNGSEKHGIGGSQDEAVVLCGSAKLGRGMSAGVLSLSADAYKCIQRGFAAVCR